MDNNLPPLFIRSGYPRRDNHTPIPVTDHIIIELNRPFFLEEVHFGLYSYDKERNQRIEVPCEIERSGNFLVVRPAPGFNPYSTYSFVANTMTEARASSLFGPGRTTQKPNLLSSSFVTGAPLYNPPTLHIPLAGGKGVDQEEPENVFATGDMEKDEKYQKIYNDLIDDWKRKNPEKDIIQHGQKEIAGDPDNPSYLTIPQKAVLMYRQQHPEEARKQDEIEQGRIHSNPTEDPFIKTTERNITIKKQKALTGVKDDKKRQEITRGIEEREWRNFGLNHSKKAAAYVSRLNAQSPGRHIKIYKSLHAAISTMPTLFNTIRIGNSFRASVIPPRITPSSQPPALSYFNQLKTPIYRRIIPTGFTPFDNPEEYQQEDQQEEDQNQPNPPDNSNTPQGNRSNYRRRSNPAKNFAKQQMKQLTKKLLKKLARQLEKKALISLLENPYSLAVIGIILLIILVIALVFLIATGGLDGGGNNDTNTSITTSSNQTTPGTSNSLLSLKVSGPDLINKLDTDVAYTITLGYNGQGAVDVQITNLIPNGTTFKSADNGGKNNSGTVTWNTSGLTSNQTKTFTLVLHVRKNATINQIDDTATATIEGGNDVVPPDGNTQPNKNTCPSILGGPYILDNPLGQNFGDPNCNYSKKKLLALLKQLDPKNVYKWQIIAELESYEAVPPHGPNAYNSHSTSGLGAYGLFQMNPDNPDYDAGRVVWQTQTSNAINYNKNANNNFCYWQSARDAGFAVNCGH